MKPCTVAQAKSDMRIRTAFGASGMAASIAAKCISRADLAAAASAGVSKRSLSRLNISRNSIGCAAAKAM